MKEKIHPKYTTVKIKCMGCGKEIVTRSTKCRDFTIDVCSNCHPFFTGRQKFVDSAGRIDRFNKKYGRTKKAPAPEKAAKEPEAEAKPEAEPEA